MDVAHKAVVLVADGRKLLFFRNEGDAAFPDLRIETAQEHANPASRDQATDAAGRASGSQAGAGAPAGASGGGGQFGQSRSSVADTDFHQLEEDRFAAQAADLLKKRALAHDFESLIVVAPARTLGELRKHYHKEVSDKLAGELAKDLTGHPVLEIEKALLAA